VHCHIGLVEVENNWRIALMRITSITLEIAFG
jgi:hypothetical protein